MGSDKLIYSNRKPVFKCLEMRSCGQYCKDERWPNLSVCAFCDQGNCTYLDPLEQKQADRIKKLESEIDMLNRTIETYQLSNKILNDENEKLKKEQF